MIENRRVTAGFRPPSMAGGRAARSPRGPPPAGPARSSPTATATGASSGPGVPWRPIRPDQGPFRDARPHRSNGPRSIPGVVRWRPSCGPINVLRASIEPAWALPRVPRNPWAVPAKKWVTGMPRPPARDGNTALHAVGRRRRYKPRRAWPSRGLLPAGRTATRRGSAAFQGGLYRTSPRRQKEKEKKGVAPPGSGCDILPAHSRPGREPWPPAMTFPLRGGRPGSANPIGASRPGSRPTFGAGATPNRSQPGHEYEARNPPGPCPPTNGHPARAPGARAEAPARPPPPGLAFVPRANRLTQRPRHASRQRGPSAGITVAFSRPTVAFPHPARPTAGTQGRRGGPPPASAPPQPHAASCPPRQRLGYRAFGPRHRFWCRPSQPGPPSSR